MNYRSFVALFLGLVFQLSQVPARTASAMASSCGNEATHVMACCEGLDACPCAKESTPTPKPAPAIPAGEDLKWVVVTTLSNPVGFIPATGSTEKLVVAVSQTENCTGYAGVPLSVAFCSHLI